MGSPEVDRRGSGEARERGVGEAKAYGSPVKGWAVSFRRCSVIPCHVSKASVTLGGVGVGEGERVQVVRRGDTSGTEDK